MITGLQAPDMVFVTTLRGAPMMGLPVLGIETADGSLAD